MTLPPDADSTLPTVPTVPVPPSPRRKRLPIRVILSAIAIVLIVAVLLGALQMVRGASATHRVDAQPNATATSAITSNDATATDTPANRTPTPSPTSAPMATNTPTQQTGAVKITQNQDMRPPCASDPAPYTIVLLNSSKVTANWHVNVPTVYANALGGSQPLSMPSQGTPYWGAATPQDGSIAPGQAVSFVMIVYWPMPCGGTTYHASVQWSFPSGISQPDIPLSYAGTGPARYSKVVLVSGSLNMTQPCPASGTAPTPYTFTIENIGNYRAVFMWIVPLDGVGNTQWATLQFDYDPTEPRTDWLYPGQTLTITVSPVAGVSCGGTVYRVKVDYTDPDGAQEIMIQTDTFI
jgi:hypothetical protein